MDKKTTDPKEPLEFYEHTTKVDPNLCDHNFTRLSISRIVCKRCGLGFFDSPTNPFPVEEMNKLIKKEIKDRKPKNIEK
jgi:hypothetical protein